MAPVQRRGRGGQSSRVTAPPPRLHGFEELWPAWLVGWACVLGCLISIEPARVAALGAAFSAARTEENLKDVLGTRQYELEDCEL